MPQTTPPTNAKMPQTTTDAPPWRPVIGRLGPLAANDSKTTAAATLGCTLLMMIVTAFTIRGVSNMKDSSYATSARVLDCQHLASSKFAPSLEVSTFTCPGAYAQSTLRPVVSSRHEA